MKGDESGRTAGAEIRVLVVDDEPLARAFVRRLLADAGGAEIVGECANGREAVAGVRDLRPDLVFLDVQMPEMDGFAVVEAVGAEAMPPVIFVTAYEGHAVRAFEIHALDYLLKPFDQARFADAWAHARERLRGRAAGEEGRQLAALLESLRSRREYLGRLIVKTGGRVIFLKTDSVDWIEADDKYARLHVGPASHLVRQTLGALEAQLDPRKFLRIHRSAMVNVERVKELHPLFNGEHTVVLDSGVRLTLSRTYRDKLYGLLGRPL